MEDGNGNTLGQLVGIVDHSFSIKNEYGEKVTLSVKIDFTGASDQDIKSWLVSNRVIAGQRPWRKLSRAELESINGSTFPAQSIGQKVKSRKEQIQALMSAGLPQSLAEFAIDRPEEFKKVSEEISKDVNEDDVDS